MVGVKKMGSEKQMHCRFPPSWICFMHPNNTWLVLENRPRNEGNNGEDHDRMVWWPFSHLTSIEYAFALLT